MKEPRSFSDVVLYCFDQKELVEQFNRLYGCSLAVVPPRSGIEALIDRACGHNPALNESDAQKFIRFVWDCIWTRLPPECFELEGAA